MTSVCLFLQKTSNRLRNFHKTGCGHLATAFNNTNLVFVGIISDREFLWKTRQVVSRQRQKFTSRLHGIDFQVSVCRPMSHWNLGGEPPSCGGQITCFPTNSVNVNEYTKTLRSYRANLIKSRTELNEVSTFF